MDLGNHCVHIGDHWEILGGWVVTFSAFRLHFGVLGSSFGFILRSFWVPWAAKIQTPSHQADIAKTYENLWFLLILEGWRLDNAHFGSLGELLA